MFGVIITVEYYSSELCRFMSLDCPRLSVVAPCFNEAEGLGEFYRRVSTSCIDVVGDDFEIVLVNDGSRDATWPLMVELADRDPHVVALNLSRNHGHQLALTAGLAHCRGDRILILDADLQDPPELLGEMMSRMDRGACIVFGQRRQRNGETRFKTWTAAVFYRVLRSLVDIDIPVDAGDFRLMNRRALDILNAMPEHHRFIRGMVSWIGLKQEAMIYDRDVRYAGVTKYPLSKMIRFAVDAVTGFSVSPLRLASFTGIVMAALGSLLLLYVLGSWLRGHVVEGWTSLAVISLIVGSVQLLVLGIMGEYLGRLYIEAKRRPLFIIDEIATQGRREIADPGYVDIERGRRVERTTS
jgi:dolichol-phosphate mannosyltransferase